MVKLFRVSELLLRPVHQGRRRVGNMYRLVQSSLNHGKADQESISKQKCTLLDLDLIESR